MSRGVSMRSPNQKTDLHLYYTKPSCCALHNGSQTLQGFQTLEGLNPNNQEKATFTFASETLFKQVFEADKPKTLDTKLYTAFTDYLQQAVNDGTTAKHITLNSKQFQKYTYETWVGLQNSISYFAAHRTYTVINELNQALFKPNSIERETFSAFKQKALKIDANYNKNYLESEYNAAVSSAIMASKWQEFEQNKAFSPYLEWSSAGDQRVRPEHVLLDGITRPVNDEFWKTKFPPLGWGCRCDVEASNQPKIDTEKHKLVANIAPVPGFDHNVGITKQVFSESHPFYDRVPDKDKAKVIALSKRLEYKILHYAENQDKITGVVLESRKFTDVNAQKVRDSAIKLTNIEGGTVKLLGDLHEVGVKNPDAEFNGRLMDMKHPKVNNNNALTKLIAKAKHQAEICLIDSQFILSESDIETAVARAEGRDKNDWALLKEIWYFNTNATISKYIIKKAK